ncbi:MAG: phosphoribosylformylglycinamidine synthase subunit PurS [Methanobacteriaceae archaeon]|jgi:phosphoribosylformylglycinamidine synthase|nr:phosphoribosylformylglycinamidine synthase subunit PurS [Methanobacteriaceae archaeon]
MKFNVEVKVSLKKGMLNPEAKTIERSLDLLGYKVSNTKTIDIIKFDIEKNNVEEVEAEVTDMCERLLSNPVIHDYKIDIIPRKPACEWTK